ncbi:Eukaryotic translation initiation factor 1A-like [Homarus americanus]|uniref:Eukaryotic translation initiation factor 1A-like n=1 Tax=Homarus americanus TaxID=6706 RepID=A0A8J5JGC7_HOMAM|nr:Eukaryotic translation initiation factor 1A-like [Homarus americanus]
MPKNKGKGGKNRRRGKNENEAEKRELIFKEEGQEYAQVWINQGDIILLGLRDYQDKKADVILKYNADEARNLKSYGEIPESVKVNENATFVEDGMDDDIEFDDYSEEEEDVVADIDAI